MPFIPREGDPFDIEEETGEEQRSRRVAKWIILVILIPLFLELVGHYVYDIVKEADATELYNSIRSFLPTYSARPP